jgi:hypothetical protein
MLNVVLIAIVVRAIGKPSAPKKFACVGVTGCYGPPSVRPARTDSKGGV